MPLSDAAAAVKSWNPHEAALGLAAVNAFFNRESNVTAGAVEYPGGGAAAAAYSCSSASITQKAGALS